MAGNANSGRREKHFLTALLMELKEAGPDMPKLRAIAKTLVKKAEEGDMQAINALMDRLDGKPMQQVEVAGEDGGPVMFKTIYETIKPEDA